MGECRDQSIDDTSIACASEKEEVSYESAYLMILIIVFSDGV